jgi:exopolyphosphatase/pppGpp-phosphohydrolase
MQAELSARYRALRALAPAATPMLVLHIGAEHTGIAVGQEADPGATLVLAIGSQKTAREFFKHTPPSPLEIEHAIHAVEDEVIRAKALIAPGSMLVTSDAGVREIALHAGLAAAPVMQLSLDALERTFNRFSAVSLGRPAAQEGLPADGAFAATLVILREFMHHHQLAQITVATPGA